MKIPSKRERELQKIVPNRSSDIGFKGFKKLYKDYTKEAYSFLANDTTLLSDNPLQFRKNSLEKIIKMSIREKIKAINNKIQ